MIGRGARYWDPLPGQGGAEEEKTGVWLWGKILIHGARRQPAPME